MRKKTPFVAGPASIKIQQLHLLPQEGLERGPRSSWMTTPRLGCGWPNAHKGWPRPQRELLGPYHRSLTVAVLLTLQAEELECLSRHELDSWKESSPKLVESLHGS